MFKIDNTLKTRDNLVWHLSLKDVYLFVLFYALMGISYWVALYITSSGSFNAWQQTIINYLLKFLWAIPVYWLIFKQFRHWPFWKRLRLHGLTMPLYILVWLSSFYFLIDNFFPEAGRLRGAGTYWDVYIGSLLYLVTFGTLHIYENYNEMKLQQQKEKLLEQLAHASELNALKAQIQPHFLFNSLNSISASVPPEMEHTRELIARLGDTFRFALHNANEETIPIRKELAFIKAYLDLEKERFSDRLQVTYKVDESILDTPIPPMLMQPLVENALHHGIAKSIEGGTVHVSVLSDGKDVVITISDSGAGLNGTSMDAVLKKGIGLSNTNLRLNKLYGNEIRIEENRPIGVSVSFRIPKSKL
ncbi:sensor histidine kinase [Flavitalea antarctica]